MSHALVLCLALVASACAQVQNDGDDGSYHPERYEKPYEYSAIYEQEQQPGPQQYQAQPQAYQQQAYQPQPQAYQPQAYQPQQQAYQPQPQTYQTQQPAYRPAQTYAKQLTDSKNAAILSEQRYLNNDGKFGSSYTQEDGVEFKEESDPDGTRRGTYSYVDPNGQRKTVSYTAGKAGFIATGDHLPVGPAPAAPAPAPQAYQPAPQAYQPAPAARAYQPQPQTYQPQPQAYQPGPAPQANGGYNFNSHF